MAHRSRSTLFVALLLLLASACGLPAAEGTIPGAAAVGDPVAEIRLDDSPAALHLAGRPGGTLVFENHMGTAHVAEVALDVAAGGSVTSYRAGDVGYWDAGERVVIFLTDGAAVPDDGVTLVGRVTVGLEELVGCASGCAVRLDAPDVSRGGAR